MLQFLAWFDPATWLTGVGSEIMGALEAGVRTLSFSLSTIIYNVVIYLYNIFELLCTGRLLSNDILRELSNRIGLILGLIMFLIIIFSMIKMLLIPDKMNDSEMGVGALLKKVILVIIMLGLSNFAFNSLYHIQKTVIESHAISNLLLPYKISDEASDKFGNILAYNLITAFYQLNNFDDEISNSEDKDTYDKCRNTVTAFGNQIVNSGKFELGYNCLNESIKVQESGTSSGAIEKATYVVNFNWAFIIIAGVVTAYLLFMYCFKVGIRMVQLAFLEIISPMAIVSYLSPKKDTMFNKWGKLYISTYIDVFIRIAIINFVIFLIATIFANTDGDGNFKFWESVGGRPENFGTEAFLMVIIILALLTFANKAPKLLENLFGTSKSGIGFGASIKDIVGLEKGAKIGTGVAGGALGGAAIGLIGGGIGGLAGGLLRGGASGLKGQGFSKTASGAWKQGSKHNAEMAKVRANGGGWFGHRVAGIQQSLGMSTASDRDEYMIKELQEEIDLYNTASKEAESEAIKNAGNYSIYSSVAGRQVSLRELDKLRVDQTITSGDRDHYEEAYNKLLKEAQMFNLDYGLAVDQGLVSFNGDGSFKELLGSSNQIYKSLDAVNGIQDKASEIGGTNNTIDAYMTKLTGKQSTTGRGKDGKNIRNNNSNKIINIKLSEQYSKNKANAGK